MFKNIKIALLLSISFFFISCSGMEMGFDEDSVFHTQTNDKIQEVQELEENQETVKTENLPKIEDTKQEEVEESETTFSYDPNAGYE